MILIISNKFHRKKSQISELHHVELLYLYSIAYYVARKKT